MVLRWLASAFLQTEKHFRKIMGQPGVVDTQSCPRRCAARRNTGRRVVSSAQPPLANFQLSADILTFGGLNPDSHLRQSWPTMVCDIQTSTPPQFALPNPLRAAEPVANRQHPCTNPDFQTFRSPPVFRAGMAGFRPPPEPLRKFFATTAITPLRWASMA